MRVGRVRRGAGETLALERGERWFDLSEAYRLHAFITEREAPPPPRGLRALMEQGALEETALGALVALLEKHGLWEGLALDGKLAFVLPFRPGKIIALGRNYAAHAAETGHDAPTTPVLFSKSAQACIGPDEPIRIGADYGRVDHEAELAIVIGKRARRLKEEDCRSVIAGYTLVNDVSARDFQKDAIEKGLPWYLSKSMDTFCPLGPVVALPSTLPWPVEVDISATVNGEVRQQSNTSRFIFSVPEVLAYITRYITLEPGDIVSTGTPEGIGPIIPGDVVEVSVPEIGTLRNPVEAAAL